MKAGAGTSLATPSTLPVTLRFRGVAVQRSPASVRTQVSRGPAAPASLEPMAQPFHAIVAIDTPSGTAYGNVRRLSMETVVFELERALVTSAEMPWRMEVPGLPAVAGGRLILRDVRPVPNLGVYSHKARLTELAEGAGALLEGWLSATAEGGELPEVDASTSVWTGVLAEANPVTSATVLSRYAARLAGGHSSSTHQSAGGGEGRDSGRRVVRNALRASIQRARLPEVADPRCQRGPGRVEVRFLSAGSLREAWQAHLCRAGLFVPLHELDAELVLDLVMPDGLVLSCPARVVAPMSNGTGLAVSMTEEQRRALEAEVG